MEYREDSVLIKDYGTKRLDYNIVAPFGKGSEIGYISLDLEGHRITVVNKDGSYAYIYTVFLDASDANAPTQLKQAVQRFNSGFTMGSTKIYPPVQSVIASLSTSVVENNNCDLLILSTNSGWT